MTNTLINTDTDADAIEQFKQLLKQPEQCLQLAGEICRKENLPEECTRMEGGSQLVVLVSDKYILKIFYPVDGEFCRNEALFLEQIQQSPLSIHTPHIYSSGSHGQYPYIVMEKLQGIPLNKIWKDLSDEEKLTVISKLGKAIRQLHSLPVERFRDASFDWHTLIDGQMENLIKNHQGYKLAEKWLSQLEEYMDFPSLDAHNPAHMVPLHTEFMGDHIFVKRENGGIICSGLIDFEPSMVGHVEYEFCAPGVFVTQGNPKLFRLFLTSYGLPETELTPQLSRRVMMFVLLHRYCDMNWFVSLIPDHFHFETLAQLEKYWFGFTLKTD